MSSTERKSSTGKTTLIVAGASALAAVAAPPVVIGVVNLLGFKAGGIAFGSAGASLMASYGGIVPAGSLVSTLQSVGAAGLGASGIIKSMTAGAVMVSTTGAAVANSRLYKKGIEPSVSMLAQGAGGLYEKGIVPLTSGLVRTIGGWFS